MITFILLILGVAALAMSFVPLSTDHGKTKLVTHKLPLRIAAGALLVSGLLSATMSVIPTAHVGVVKTFGKVSSNTLVEGLHFTAPWDNVVTIRTGMDVSEVKESQAASKDLQSVSSDIVVNFYVDPTKASELYKLDPAQRYHSAFVYPAIAEVFKAVVAQYTAEELVTKRQQVSDSIVQNLNTRLAQYHMKVQTVNMVNFGFSKAFDAAIEEKVTASQKAETAKRDLERIKYEAESRVAAAEGEAKAIAIQAAAIDKQGGAAYVQLKAVEKWDGQLPTYMTSGAATPFVQLK